MNDIPRGKYMGVCEQVKAEHEHFYRCAACGGLVDCRDLGAVFDHETPLPHPASDMSQ